MANLAVKFYEDVDASEKPAGIPDAWPAETVNLGSSTELPESGGPWTLMTEAEYDTYVSEHQSEYDTWLAAYELAAAKTTRLGLLQGDANSFLEAHYPLLTRFQLMNLYTLAKFDELTNRAAYIRPAIDWANSIAAYALSRVALIQAQTSVENVDAVTWDFPNNIAADPAKTVGGALAITD